MSRRTETAYKAESLGKSAQHDNALGLGDTVNAALHNERLRSYTPRGGTEKSPVEAVRKRSLFWQRHVWHSRMIEQESAEAILGAGRRSTGVWASGNEPGEEKSLEDSPRWRAKPIEESEISYALPRVEPDRGSG